MAAKLKNYEYFTFDPDFQEATNKKPKRSILTYIFLLLLVVFSIPTIFYSNLFIFVLFILLMFYVTYTYAKSTPVKKLYPSEAAQQVENRAIYREHFANINDLEYQYEVALESDIDIVNDDYIANHYIAGEINGIAFWNADTIFTFIRTGKYEQYAQMHKRNATAIFTDAELPKIYIVRNTTLVAEQTLKLVTRKPNIIKITQQFDKKYTVFVPKNYERDALYFLTPELLELILKYDPSVIEIEKQRIIIHAYDAVETEDQYRLLAEMIQELGAEFIDNTKRYKDGRSKVKNKIHKSGTVVKI